MNETYVPDPELLALGLPIISWPTGVCSMLLDLANLKKWNSDSTEGAFLRKLGIMRAPSLSTLLVKITNEKSRDRALQYLLKNYASHGYLVQLQSLPVSSLTPFLPDKNSVLHVPSDVYSNPAANLLGFAVLRKDFRGIADGLGVKSDPASKQLVDCLTKSPPKTQEQARAYFAYMGGMLDVFTKSEKLLLSSSEIVPITEGDGTLRYERPMNCFFDRDDRAVFGSIFPWIDFGDVANQFLMFVGAQRKVSAVNIARVLSEKPRHIFDRCSSVSQYKSLLYQISINFSDIERVNGLKQALRASSFAIGTISESAGAENGHGDTEPEDIAWVLRKPTEICIVDDVWFGALSASNDTVGNHLSHV